VLTLVLLPVLIAAPGVAVAAVRCAACCGYGCGSAPTQLRDLPDRPADGLIGSRRRQMDAFGVEFGKALGQIVGEYRTAFAGVALLWHVSTLAVLCLVVRYGNRYRRLFAAYFTLAYAWLVVFVGVWMSVQLFERMGAVALAVYGATPAFLLVILVAWLRELRSPRLDLDLRSIERWRLLVAVPMFLWGFWYPPYIFGERLVFDPAELMFGAYGLMGCPTTMVVLSLLFLTYPSGNRRLFHLLTAYAVLVGAAMVALRYVPDIPFFILGIASVALIVRSGRHIGKMTLSGRGEVEGIELRRPA
jgi:hypothetical protein